MAVPPELSMRDSVKAKSLALSVVTPPSSAARAAPAAPHATTAPAAAAANLRDQVLQDIDIRRREFATGGPSAHALIGAAAVARAVTLRAVLSAARRTSGKFGERADHSS